jgi:hypothetical protein
MSRSLSAPRAGEQEQQLLRTVDAARILNVSVRTMHNWRWKGCGPRFLRVGRHLIRYRLADLHAFLVEGGKAQK